MQVTNVQVSFMREKQPAKFEKAQPSVELAAVLDDGEDHRAAARTLMLDAATVVYAGIGYGVPAKVSKALQAGEVPAELSATAATEGASEGSETAPEASKKPRGRPVGSKNSRPKAGSKAAKAAEAAAKANDGLPPEDGDDQKPLISTDPENRVGPDDLPPEDGDEGNDSPAPDADASEQQEPDAPSADAAPEAEYTAKDLHTLITDSVKAKKLTVPQAKKVLAHFKVARAQDLTPQQVAEGKVMVDQMLAGS